MIKSTRFTERLNLKIPLKVDYRENASEEWTENTHTKQISACGIGFSLSRPVEPNRLIRLELPMPKKYRLFGFGKEHYSVWAMICYVQMLESNLSDKIDLMIGTALIGEHPPASFLQNPQTLYDLKPILKKQSFWYFREMPRRSGPYMRSAEERRLISIKINLKLIDNEGQIKGSIEAETLNISESGAAVIVKSAAECLRYIIIDAKEQKISLLAVLRGIHQVESPDLFRLHLEFISGKWSF